MKNLELKSAVREFEQLGIGSVGGKRGFRLAFLVVTALTLATPAIANDPVDLRGLSDTPRDLKLDDPKPYPLVIKEVPVPEKSPKELKEDSPPKGSPNGEDGIPPSQLGRLSEAAKLLKRATR